MSRTPQIRQISEFLPEEQTLILLPTKTLIRLPITALAIQKTLLAAQLRAAREAARETGYEPGTE